MKGGGKGVTPATPGGLFTVSKGTVYRKTGELSSGGKPKVKVDSTLNASLKQSNAYIMQKKQEEAKAAGQEYVSSKVKGRAVAQGAPTKGRTDVKATLSQAKAEVKAAKKKTDAEFLFKGLKAGTPEYYKAYYEQIKRQKLVRQGKLRGKRRNKKK